MKKKTKLLRGLLFLLCIGIMDYPFMMRAFHSREQKGAVAGYREMVEDLKERERFKMLEDAENYNAALYKKGVSGLWDAFTGEDRAEDGYHDLLNADGKGMLGVIEIPKIQAELPVFHGTSADTLQKGAGHLEGSSLPVGGENTHTCIAAHRGLPSRELFTKLDLLKEGDMFYLHVLGKTLAYQVQDVKIVMPDEIDSLQIQKGKDLATLITCTPYGINTHRLYVQGARTGKGRQGRKTADNVRAYWWAPVTGGLVFLYIISSREKDKKQFCQKCRDR